MNLIIPIEEKSVTDKQVFEQLDLNYKGLEKVRKSYTAGDIDTAKKELVDYFYGRNNVKFLFDYRGKPLKKINPDVSPYSWQSSLGFSGNLKEFCLNVGKKMLDNIYVLPGRSKIQHDLGENFENMIHFNFLTDLRKGHRHKLDMFTRGQFFESLAILYHEDGDEKAAKKYKEVVEKMFETYNLTIENTSSDATRMQCTEDRDIMSIGWLTIVLIGLLYTELPYTAHHSLTFEIIKRIWFFSIQFRRFDNDYYRPYNHHMWERGLMPYILSILLPEFPEIKVMKEKGRSVVNQHVLDDFNEQGGYSEHSIAYWAGAVVGEMLYRGMYIANVNSDTLLNEKAFATIDRGFDTLASISSPSKNFASIGDNGGPEINPILTLGTRMTNNTSCREVLKAREAPDDSSSTASECSVPLDYFDTITGFATGRSSWTGKANCFMMTVKENCGHAGHNHMDMLSVCLWVRGEEIFGEPYVDMLYHKVKMDSEERGFLYNMTSHNTVLAYSKPVRPNNDYANKWGVFKPDTHVNQFESSKAAMFISGYHDAYTFCRHYRQVLFVREKGWVVRDRIMRGNRQEDPHIQRWYLEKGVDLEVLSDNAILLKKNCAKLLCVWRKTEGFKLTTWKKEDLYPEIMPNREDINFTIDAVFKSDSNCDKENINLGMDVLFLDVSDREELPNIEKLNDLVNGIKNGHLNDEGIIKQISNL